MSPGSLVKTTALPCFTADSATQASTVSGFFLGGSFAAPRAVPRRRQSRTSGPVAHATHSGRPTLVPSTVLPPPTAAPLMGCLAR